MVSTRNHRTGGKNMNKLWKEVEFRTIYSKIQRQIHRLKIKQDDGFDLSFSEIQLLQQKPIDLAKREYQAFVDKRIHEEQLAHVREELSKKRHCLRYDKWCNRSQVTELDAVEIDGDYYPLPKKRKKQQLGGWEF